MSNESKNKLEESADTPENISEVEQNTASDIRSATGDPTTEDVATPDVAETKKSGLSSGKVIFIIVVGCVLLAIANISLWATFDLFDAQRFGKLVAEGIQSDQVSAVLAGEIVDEILVDHPNIPTLVRNPAEEIVTALLQRPILTKAIKDMAAVANVVLTTNVDDVVSIDLERVVPFVVGVAVAINPELADTVEEFQESKVLKLLDPNALPKLRGAAKVMPWLWPLALLSAIGLFFVATRWAENRRTALKWVGLGVVITGAIELIFIPSVRQAVEINITNPNGRLIVGEVVNTLTRGLLIQCLALILIGLIIIVASRYYFKEAQLIPESKAI